MESGRKLFDQLAEIDALGRRVVKYRFRAVERELAVDKLHIEIEFFNLLAHGVERTRAFFKIFAVSLFVLWRRRAQHGL